MSRLRSDPGSNPHENEFVSGYPARICDHVPGNKYLCCNCNNVLKKAQQTLCGHRYCSPCLSWIVRNHKTPICPKCEEDPGSLTEDSYLTEDKAFSDTAINKEISELKVHCVTSGCQWSGVLGEYEDHQSVCNYVAIRCHTGCGEMLQRKILAFHLEHECSNNTSVCPKCFQRIPRHLSPKHNCEKTLSKDPNSRKSNIPTKSKNNQPDTMDCRFAPLGCIYRGSRDQIRDHEGLAAASHVSLVLPVLLQIQSARPAAAVKENGFCDYNGDGHKLPASIRNGESVDEEMATDCGSHNGGVTGPHLISRICALESRIQVAENIIMVMNREIDSSNVKRATALEESNEERGRVRACETKIADLRCTIAKKDMEINRLQVHLASLEQTSYDGIFLWKISDLTRKCQDAREGRTISLYSPAFYTAKYGYKVRLRVYLNGDGAGKGTHISLFFTVMRGEYDVLLPWPFKHKVTFMLLDQSNREHVIDAFRPDTTSISFQKPAADMNIASGCPLFCPLSKLHAIRNNYVVDETMFIRCIIDAN
ncbi:TNF receptor-associated factor 1 isoform X1 [Rhinoderma darwinii]|uniref:TNF receptor-associated factor 1 isoform X1 n=1 Tax=Rhinoderma darwinii TaxID=43563 RepID=UPI003F675573